MFKKILSQIVFVLSILIGFSACMEDEGNYDYSEINEVEFSEINETYSVLRFEDFKLEPELIFTMSSGDESNYTYRWLAIQKNVDFDDVDISTELATTKDLDIKVELLPNDYRIYYTVTDESTGIEWQHDFELKVNNGIYQGWLVLNSVNDEPRLDMVSLVKEEYQTMHDVLGFVDSELTLTGTPKFVYYNLHAKPFEGIYVSTTGNGTTKLEPELFGWDPAYNISQEFATTQPDDLEVDNMVSFNYSGHSYVVKDGDVLVYHRIFNLTYDVPINIIGGTRFEASPFISIGNWGGAILYDNTNKRFVHSNYGSTNEITAVGDKFDFNTGKDLVYMEGSNYNSGMRAETFAVLKDPVDDKHYLALFNAGTFEQSYYGEILATNFEQATTYAFSPDFGYMFYAVGSKVYQYDFSLGTTKLMLDKGSEEITLLQFQSFNFFYISHYDNLSKKLVVCSYDESGDEGSNGTMELYSVPPVNGQIVLEDQYTGFGKIVSVSYRERY